MKFWVTRYFMGVTRKTLDCFAILSKHLEDPNIFQNTITVANKKIHLVFFFFLHDQFHSSANNDNYTINSQILIPKRINSKQRI